MFRYVCPSARGRARLFRVGGLRLLGDGEPELLFPLRGLLRPEEQDTEVEADYRGVRESPISGPRVGNGAFGLAGENARPPLQRVSRACRARARRRRRAAGVP